MRLLGNAARLVGGLMVATAPLCAQNSVYGVQGAGFPLRPYSIHARGSAGAIGVFDPGSAINPATAAAFGCANCGITAHLSAATSFRRYAAYDSTVSGLLETRFPLAMVGAPLSGTPLAFTVSYGPYLERSYDFRTSGVVVLRAESVTVSDQLSSDGGVADFRLALGYLVARRVQIGVAGHLLTGSSKLRLRREFSSADYQSFGQRSDHTFTGSGVSLGLYAELVTGVQVAMAARTDSRLTTVQDGFPRTSVDLPVTLTAGLRLQPARRVVWAATAERRSWTDAAPDLSAGVTVFDTWEVASGLEIGGYDPISRSTRIPVRLGVRYGTLPFSGRATQAHELVLAGGSALNLGSRVAVDLALERITRSGGGAEERLWQGSVGITLVP